MDYPLYYKLPSILKTLTWGVIVGVPFIESVQTFVLADKLKVKARSTGRQALVHDARSYVI